MIEQDIAQFNARLAFAALIQGLAGIAAALLIYGGMLIGLLIIVPHSLPLILFQVALLFSLAWLPVLQAARSSGYTRPLPQRSTHELQREMANFELQSRGAQIMRLFGTGGPLPRNELNGLLQPFCEAQRLLLNAWICWSRRLPTHEDVRFSAECLLMEACQGLPEQQEHFPAAKVLLALKLLEPSVNTQGERHLTPTEQGYQRLNLPVPTTKTKTPPSIRHKS